MSDIQSHISADSFFHTSSPNPSSKPPLLIYFITGNPGLIGYYQPFLSLLSERLKVLAAQQSKDYSFQIYGHSLAGFELGPGNEHHGSHYYDLEEQICFVQRKLSDFLAESSDGVEHSQSKSYDAAATKPKVILIGHSVGAYIAMEVLRRHREGSTNGGTRKVDFDIIGGTMLFPTVVDIAKSPSGLKLTRLLSLIPRLALVASLIVRVLTAFVPDAVLRFLIRLYMGSSAPAEMVNATSAFLKSKRGVQQALHMAADEMQTITSDKWTDDVWGISSAVDSVTARLFFYFGRNDHWVAERTRDDIVEARGAKEGGPTMVVCEDGLPHAFCIRHSDVVARKVADMVMGIVG